MHIYLKTLEDRGQFTSVSGSPQGITDVRTPAAIRINIDSCSRAEAQMLAEYFLGVLRNAPLKLLPIRQDDRPEDWDKV